MDEISLVITTYNRVEYLVRSLERLTQLTVPDEIVVVDDGGLDATGLVIKALHPELPIRYVYNDRPWFGNRCQPTNVGIRHAKHDLIMHTDPEVEFLTDIVGQFRAALPDHPDDILAPWNGWHEAKPGSGDEDFLACPGNGLHDNGGNVFLYRKAWIEEIGGWDEQLGPGGFDDVDFHTRLAWNGHRQVAVPGTEIRHRWHPPIPWNAGAPDAQASSLRNKQIVEGKQFPRDLVANVGREWGVLC